MATTVLAPPPLMNAESLTFKVSPTVARELRTLAEELGMSLPQLFGYGMSILTISAAEAKKNRKLVIADDAGNALREIVLPAGQNASVSK